MANFYDLATRKPLTKLKLPVGGVARIGLWGGGPNAEKLEVTTIPGAGAGMKCDGAVRLVKDHGDWNFTYEIHDKWKSSRHLRACTNDGDYAQQVELVASESHLGGAEDIRQSIVDLARGFVREKSHYLWGTAGNAPDVPNGNPGGSKTMTGHLRAAVTAKVKGPPQSSMGVQMAWSNVTGYCTCAGRCDAADMLGRQRDMGASHDAYVAAAPEDPNSIAWRGVGGDNLHPRHHAFNGTMADKPVWGESCIGKRHFDCVGLVNYCYSAHGSGQFGLSIPAFRSRPEFEQVTDPADRLNGDVLIFPNDAHIGMLWNDGGSWKVVQAVDTRHGLTDSAVYDADKWHRYRMAPGALRPRRSMM